MYISYDDYEISRDPVENGFEVDELIAPTISSLNKLGYRTGFCCSGHPDCRYHPEHAYFLHHIEQHTCDQRFIELARAMGRPLAASPEEFLLALTDLKEACGMLDLSMADYGITPEEFPAFADNALETMGGLFVKDPSPVTRKDIIRILQESYEAV